MDPKLMEDIWACAEEGLDEIRVKKDVIQHIDCYHTETILDTQTADIVCVNCGCVTGVKTMYNAEWNNYKDDSGNYSKNAQRADLYVDDNPYSVGGSVCNMFKSNRCLAAKIHLQSVFSHKQRTFWQISQIFENIVSKNSLPIDILSTSKKLWHICMESGILTRAAVREGLIASCFYYACIHNRCPISRQDILIFFECDTKTLSKGEKVFYTIIESNESFRYLTKESINIQENDSFVKYCSKLKLEFKVAMLCNDIFNKYKTELNVVTPKSATCGVLVYVIKKKLKLKNPTKSELSTMMNVCTPTTNKVVDILVNCESLSN